MWKLLGTLQIFLLFHFSTQFLPIPGLDILIPNPLERVTLFIYGPNDSIPTTRQVEDDFKDLPIDVNFPVKFLLHGWTGSHEVRWMTALIDAFQKNPDQKFNLIKIDYVSARTLNYLKAANAVANIGKRLGIAIWKIVNNNKFTWKQVHIIGLSLGAQVAGSTGRYIQHLGQKVDRITGLDAARPLFEFPALFPALSSSDADFVDVIHTNGKIQGMYESIGHVDFFPNGGTLQPGCPIQYKINKILLRSQSKLESLLVIGCDHERAIWYFIESISSDRFVSRKCSDYVTYTSGLCINNEKNIMGLNTHRNTSGNFYLTTYGESPYAKG